jgi:tRNA wybutosine-synthesizing protein 1
VDQPRMILDNALLNHKQMINTMKGVPGVQPDRLAAAQKPRHCALSLVGEPIMYPHINEYVRMLHEENISSFLVTNAQFPEAMIAMEPVCQLYVSIDAATEESLKAVDRPLFKDFWQRFQTCLKAIRDKKQRTVYRMTLVKSFNMQEVIEYAKLVAIGKPTFIEIKGVTFCGGGKGSGTSEITMKDVPLHEEVKSFAEQLCKFLPSLECTYEMASEHEHSCCVLISDTRMKRDGKWCTWIDYEEFNRLVRRYYATGEQFTDEDYMAETPAWAVYGAKEAGFSPYEKKKSTGAKARRPRPTLAELDAKYPELQAKNAAAQAANIAAHLASEAKLASASSASSPAAIQ